MTNIQSKISDDKKVKDLFELYSKKLFHYSIYKWKIAEDVAWELIYKTIYKVAEKSNEYEFKDDKKFASFIFKVHINNIRDHLRSDKVKKNDITEIEINDKLINNYEVPVSNTSQSLPLKILQEELDKLMDWERILVLMRAQDVPYNEIAKYVDKPENQLKTYYSRLKKQLMEKINERITNLNLKQNGQ